MHTEYATCTLRCLTKNCAQKIASSIIAPAPVTVQGSLFRTLIQINQTGQDTATQCWLDHLVKTFSNVVMQAYQDPTLSPSLQTVIATSGMESEVETLVFGVCVQTPAKLNLMAVYQVNSTRHVTWNHAPDIQPECLCHQTRFYHTSAVWGHSDYFVLMTQALDHPVLKTNVQLQQTGFNKSTCSFQASDHDQFLGLLLKCVWTTTKVVAVSVYYYFQPDLVLTNKTNQKAVLVHHGIKLRYLMVCTRLIKGEIPTLFYHCWLMMCRS